MRSFRFQGPIPSSKSMMNRALLIQSYFPDLLIHGDSTCDDVVHMRSALTQLHQKQEIFCGEAGTVFRFLALRASRDPGTYRLTGSQRLLARPHDEIVYLLEQLSVSSQLDTQGLTIHSQGWKKPLIPLQVHRETSSQFATSLLLNSWNLNFDLEFGMRVGVSEGYWKMTLEMAQQAGMAIENRQERWRVPAQQKISMPHTLEVEPDLSSAFAIAAAGALAGESIIQSFPAQSLQPDHIFVDLLKQMGIAVVQSPTELKVQKTESIKPIHFDLKSCPDLFPCLAVLCAFADGESVLGGAPHLVHKESNRVKKTLELLNLAGIACSVKGMDVHIHGRGPNIRRNLFQFSPDQDHRMAMASGLLMLKGFEVQLMNAEVVSKSFPEFWKILGFYP